MIKFSFPLVLSSFALVGCTSSGEEVAPIHSEIAIEFGHNYIGATAAKSMTKTETTALSTTVWTDISAWAYNGATVNSTPLFSKQILRYRGTLWALSQTYYWPLIGNTDLRMVAYAPSSSTTDDYAENIDGFSSPQISSSGIKLGLFVPQETFNQTDLLYTVAQDYSKGNPVNLLFKHALTMINFNISSTTDSVLITNITLNDIPNRGFLQTTDVATWTLPSDVATSQYVVYEATAGGTPFYANQIPKQIGSQHLLIPQTLTDAMTFDVDFKVGSQSFTFNNLKLNALTSNGTSYNVWNPGTLVNYNLNIDNERIEFEAPNVESFVEESANL